MVIHKIKHFQALLLINEQENWCISVMNYLVWRLLEFLRRKNNLRKDFFKHSHSRVHALNSS